MTPTFRWVFLLALVGRAASIPRPMVVDACALLCNPGAETESERERDPVLFPRYPKVNCKRQSGDDEHQAWVIASTCLRLCDYFLPVSLEVNCFALRSSLGANLGCYCEALTPLSPNTMRLHETWRLNFLVKELANDIQDVILKSPIDTIILCDIHDELFKKSMIEVIPGNIVKVCLSQKEQEPSVTKRRRRDVKEQIEQHPDELPPMWKEQLQFPSEKDSVMMKKMKESSMHMPMDTPMHEPPYEPSHESTFKPMYEETHESIYKPMEEPIDEPMEEPMGKPMDEPKEEILKEMMLDESLRRRLFPSLEDRREPDEDSPLFRAYIRDWKRVCQKLCRLESGNRFCNCKNLELY